MSLATSAEDGPERSTRGTFHYVDPDRITGPGFRFNFDPQWSGIPLRDRRVPVADACTLSEPPRLDREGFELGRLGIGEIDHRDPGQVEALWRPAVCRLVQQITGADEVASWATGARFSERNAAAARTDVSNPARRVHSDFSPTEFGAAILHPPALEAIERIAPGRPLRRWMGINVWQAISPPPYDTPLAVCDTRTVRPEDLVVGRGSAPSVPGLEVDLPLYQFSDRHRWFYYSHMEPDQALVFSGIDSAAVDDWRLVPHSAFDDPACPSGATPRSSVEIRTMALFFA